MNSDPRPRKAPDPDHLEDLVDEAEQESFPASDPPAVTPRREPVRKEREEQPPDAGRVEPRPD